MPREKEPAPTSWYIARPLPLNLNQIIHHWACICVWAWTNFQTIDPYLPYESIKFNGQVKCRFVIKNVNQSSTSCLLPGKTSVVACQERMFVLLLHLNKKETNQNEKIIFVQSWIPSFILAINMKQVPTLELIHHNPSGDNVFIFTTNFSPVIFPVLKC